MNFYNISCLAQHISWIIFQHVIHIKIINKVFHIILFIHIFEIQLVFYTDCMSPFR